jgi:uncharacterized protein (DUF1330 family)
MKAYVIATMTITDQARYDRYRAQVVATLAPFGATFLVRGGAFAVKEGSFPHARVVVLEFPSRQAAEDWYASPAYQAIIADRLQASTGTVVIADGAG